MPRTFLEVARHRLPGATFDSLLREALAACSEDQKSEKSADEKSKDNAVEQPKKVVPIKAGSNSMPVVVSPDPN